MFHRFFSQIFFGWCCYKCGSRFVFTSLMSYLLDDKWAPRFECRLPTPFHKQEMLRWPAERPLPGHPVGIHIYKCTWGRMGVRIQILRLQLQIKIDDPPAPLVWMSAARKTAPMWKRPPREVNPWVKRSARKIRESSDPSRKSVRKIPDETSARQTSVRKIREGKSVRKNPCKHIREAKIREKNPWNKNPWEKSVNKNPWKKSANKKSAQKNSE